MKKKNIENVTRRLGRRLWRVEEGIEIFVEGRAYLSHRNICHWISFGWFRPRLVHENFQLYPKFRI